MLTFKYAYNKRKKYRRRKKHQYFAFLTCDAGTNLKIINNSTTK